MALGRAVERFIWKGHTVKKLITLVTLSGVVLLPTFAQSTPKDTNLDQSAARMETRNARGKQLTAVSAEQARANALQRCASLPPFYKVDCENRVNGQGEVSGSVIGGGLVKESVTTMPKAQLESELQNSGPMNLPAPRQ